MRIGPSLPGKGNRFSSPAKDLGCRGLSCRKCRSRLQFLSNPRTVRCFSRGAGQYDFSSGGLRTGTHRTSTMRHGVGMPYRASTVEGFAGEPPRGYLADGGTKGMAKQCPECSTITTDDIGYCPGCAYQLGDTPAFLHELGRWRYVAAAVAVATVTFSILHYLVEAH